MGKETIRELAQMGARVILACCSDARGNAAAVEITERSGAKAPVTFLTVTARRER